MGNEYEQGMGAMGPESELQETEQPDSRALVWLIATGELDWADVDPGLRGDEFFNAEVARAKITIREAQESDTRERRADVAGAIQQTLWPVEVY